MFCRSKTIANHTKYHPSALPTRCKIHLKELEMLQEQGIIASVGVEETSELGTTFVLIPKPNGTIRLYTDSPRVNKALLSFY